MLAKLRYFGNELIVYLVSNVFCLKQQLPLAYSVMNPAEKEKTPLEQPFIFNFS